MNGSSVTIQVPQGHRHVIKQLTAYGSSTVEGIRVFFESVDSGAALWAADVPNGTSAWFGFYGALVFLPGSSYKFRVQADVLDAADVYAGGYDLVESG